MPTIEILHDDGSLRVFDETDESETRRVLTFGPNFRIKQGFIRRADPLYLPGPAFQKMLFGASLAPSVDSALILGMGVGSVPAALRDLYAGTDIDVVDNDARVFDVSQRLFARELSHFNCHCVDARVYIESCQKRYDYACVDIWNGDDTPAFLLEESFWRALRVIIAPDGIVSINMRYLHQKQAFDLLSPHFARMLSLRDNNCSLVLFAGDGSRNVILEEDCPRYARYGVNIPGILEHALAISPLPGAGAWPRRIFSVAGD